MKITINGEEREIAAVAPTVADVLRALALPLDRGGIAVARNEVVVPRARWGEVAVAEGDRFEVITAVQGG